MKGIIALSLLLAPVALLAQFTGRVVNENNQGIPYASVSVKKSTTGVVTDSIGYFTLSTEGLQFPFTLVITSSGFESRQLFVRDQSVNNLLIQLQPLFQTDTIVVTSRRRREVLQNVPVSVSVVTGALVTMRAPLT